MSDVKEGDPAPAFELPADGGGRISSASLECKPYVIYFYPKDDTPGCTTQACGLRDSWSELEARGEIFGVSVDSTKSHEKFISKYQLPFPLLSDPEHKTVEAYGVWVEKSMYGKKYMGIDRSTYLVGPDGKIAQVWRKVSVPGHVEEVLAAATALKA